MTAAAALALLTLAAPAAAETIKPTRFDDPTPNGCKPGNCSLREAITRANKHAGRDKVKLAEGTYELELAETLGDDNKGGDFDVLDAVTIAGKGPGTIVDGKDVSGVFSLLTFSPHALKNMTITNGNRNFGAGIATSPSKTVLKGLVVQSNTTTGSGGGLYTVSQNLTISNSTFAGNHADLGGGGIYMPTGIQNNPPPDAKIESSTFSGNDAALGAGLYLDGADHDGVFNVDPQAEVLNSTFAGNQATVSGGGVAAILGSELRMDYSTVAFNAADTDNSGGGAGGGIYQSTDGDLAMYDSILLANTVGTSGDGQTCAGEVFLPRVVLTPQGGASCTLLGGSVTQGEVPPKLGTLTDNGGTTETIEILTGSAAVGFGELCPKRDQRGIARPAEDCDVGAFEREGP
jgi:hypothetical protein